MKIRLTFAFILFAIITFSQDGETEIKPKLNRYFVDWVPSGVLSMPKEKTKYYNYGSSSIIENPIEYAFGLQFKMGNNWYFQNDNFTGVLRLTWFRIGLGWYDGLLALVSPFQIGFGGHFALSKNISFEPMLSIGGVVIALGIDPYPSYLIMPEVKFNFGRFALGFEYTFLPENPFDFKSSSRINHYLGLSLGIRMRNID